MRKVLFLLLFVLPLLPLRAQYGETISTDRPGQALTPFGVGKGAFQAEIGLGLAGSSALDDSFENQSFLFTSFFKYGLTETVEINYGVNLLNQGLRVEPSPEEEDTGVQGMNVGLRFNILTGEGTGPSLGFLFSLFMNNFSHPAFRTEYVAPRFTLIYSQPLGERFTINSTAGMSWNGENGVPQGNYVVNLGIGLTNNLSAFVEVYGFVLENTEFLNYYDAGIAWLLNPNLQLDLAGGYGSNDGIREYYLQAGVSVRTSKKSN